MLGSVTFQGLCKGSMEFLIKGTLQAPTDSSKFFTDTWIGFQYLDDLTVEGGGSLDGQGSAAWGFNDCAENSKCSPLPAVSLSLKILVLSSLFASFHRNKSFAFTDIEVQLCEQFKNPECTINQ